MPVGSPLLHVIFNEEQPTPGLSAAQAHLQFKCKHEMYVQVCKHGFFFHEGISKGRMQGPDRRTGAQRCRLPRAAARRRWVLRPRSQATRAHARPWKPWG